MGEVDVKASFKGGPLDGKEREVSETIFGANHCYIHTDSDGQCHWYTHTGNGVYQHDAKSIIEPPTPNPSPQKGTA